MQFRQHASIEGGYGHSAASRRIGYCMVRAEDGYSSQGLVSSGNFSKHLFLGKRDSSFSYAVSGQGHRQTGCDDVGTVRVLLVAADAPSTPCGRRQGDLRMTAPDRRGGGTSSERHGR